VLVFLVPIVLLATLLAVGAAFVAVSFVVLAPLLPFAVVALIVWAVMRASRPAVSL
jgi:hypothetical protein